jgi:predicted esterase YcpF (UPF0227 family)
MIVYLHGFNSGGNSGKASWLREHLPDIPVLAPTYPVHRADRAPDVLRDWIARARRERPAERRLLLVGSSLGGFWARHLAPELRAGMVLINPAIHPEVDLLEAVGPNTNEATGERYVLTADEVRAFARCEHERCDPAVPTLVLLDEGDELLDWRVAQDYYRDGARVIVYPGGTHRFEHLPEALPEIRALHERCPD